MDMFSLPVGLLLMAFMLLQPSSSQVSWKGRPGEHLLWNLSSQMETFAKNGSASSSSAQLVVSDCVYDPQEFASSTRLADEIFERQFCHRKQASSEKDFFQPGYDVPAEIISLWTPQYLGARMQETSSKSDLKERIDLQAIHDMNLVAAHLWERLVQCAGNPEAARVAYYHNNFPCSLDGEDARLTTELNSLHQQVVDFVKTTDLTRLNYDLENDPNRKVIEFHPLLLQVFEELFAVWFPIEIKASELRRWTRQNIKTEQRLDFAVRISALLPVLQRFETAPTGLWPLATRGAHRYYMAKFIRVFHGNAYYKTGMAVIESPWDPLIHRTHKKFLDTVIDWVAPLSWLNRVTNSLELVARGRDKMDPNMKEVAPGDIHAIHSRYIVKELIQIAKRYKLTRKSIR